jgi:hypothetical protein
MDPWQIGVAILLAVPTVAIVTAYLTSYNRD